MSISISVIQNNRVTVTAQDRQTVITAPHRITQVTQTVTGIRGAAGDSVMELEPRIEALEENSVMAINTNW